MPHTPLDHFMSFAATSFYGISSALSSLGTDPWGSPAQAGIRMQTSLKLQKGKQGPREVK